jgi:integrase
VAVGPVAALLERYRAYLISERGLTPGTARCYLDAIRPFVAGRLRGEQLDLAGLTAADVTGFVVAACPGRAQGTAKLIVTTLRSLLRWLHVEGVIAAPLAGAVPSVAGWRLAGLPGALEPEQLRRLLASCDRRRGLGRRDYAILLLLSRLGLRAGEVAALGLDDLDWRAAEIVVRGRANRAERLPLPADVGEAIVAYLQRGRPVTAQGRSVFVRAKAPHLAFDQRGGVDGRARRCPRRRARHHARAPPAIHRRHADAARRDPADRGWAGAAAAARPDHSDLREGRPRRLAVAGTTLAATQCGWPVVTAALHDALGDYLTMRRALGYRLVRPEKLLHQFLDHLDATGVTTVTSDAALAWSCLPAGGDVNWWAYRLSVVRGFATYLHTLDAAVEIPATDLLPWRARRANPYLYSTADIAALLTAAESLSTPLRRATIATLIGLLAVTGIRVGEAIALDRADFDQRHGLLVVRHGKFNKSRELVLHPSTVTALQDYLRERDRLHPAPSSPALLISMAGTRLIYCNVHWTFHRLVQRAGLAARSASCRPRIHDLRHSFAVAAMLDAYAAGQDGQVRLTLLSTYLGHVDPAGTYWYLSASPELLALAGQRLERRAGRT